jgi:curved DNA-binding protein CbpA
MKFDPAKDYYAILGISRTATDSDIHQAYKSMVSRYHPDKHQGNDLEDLAREKLVQINEAYRVLSKIDLKSAYDDARWVSGYKNKENVPPYPGGNYGSPSPPPVQSGALRKWIQLILLLVATPLLIRFVRSPRIALVLGIAILLAWFGPRLLKKLKK